MASVWKRLQRVNKRAAKFQYTASYHRIDLETTAKWKPSKLSIVWTRRSRRVATEPLDWEPTLKDPLKGSVNYPVAENHSVAVTLFKDSRTNELEDKDWTFVLEDVSSNGKRRRIAQANINMRLYASLQPSQRSITVPLQPTSKVKSASIALTLHCVLLREGSATDEDMQSLASLLSVNNNSDIAVLEDLDGDITLSDDSSRQVLDLCQQMEQLTRSLSETPDSVRSLPTDTRTPTAPASPDTPLGDDIKTPQNTYPARTDKDIFDPTEPKFSYSPPKFSIPSQLDNKQNKLDTKTDTQPYRGPIFKTKSVTKINLKPLDLKTNLNLNLEKERELKTPEEETMQEKMDRVKTPVQDLLEWCQSVTEDYRQAKITDLTSSFRSGIAFCAIIHHFRPELIDFGGLDPTDQVATLRTAFSASAALGLPPLLCVADMTKATLDRLQIMTYLFQLRAHFTGSELEVEQLGNSESESTYLVGRHDTDERLPPALFSREIVTRRSRNMLKPHIKPQVLQEFESSTPDSAKDVRDANNVFKTLSPVKDNKSSERTTNWYTDPLRVDDEESRAPTRLMSRRELSDPFDFTHDSADTPTEPSPDQKTPTERDEKSPVSLTQQQAAVSPTTDLPKPTPQLLSRHDELKEKARQLLEATKREARSKRQSSKETEDEMANGNGVVISPIMEDTNSVTAGSPQGTAVGTPGTMGETAEARQARLRERARRLIADARAGLLSPTSPNRGRGTMEIINQQTVLEEVANNGGDIEALLGRSESIHSSPSRRSHSLSPDRSEGRNSSESRSEKSPEHRAATDLSGLAELAGLKGITLSPEHDRAQAGGTRYIESEQAALEREQAAVDRTAAALEARLRHAMDSHDTQEEDRLLSQWFHLVNKKNALLRRQMQLNILEREDDLSARCSLLGRQLRQSLALDDWRKTPAQRDRERLLLQELVEAVNERDRLVQEMDEQEKAIADDNEIERNLSQVDLQRKNNCVIQ